MTKIFQVIYRSGPEILTQKWKKSKKSFKSYHVNKSLDSGGGGVRTGTKTYLGDLIRKNIYRSEHKLLLSFTAISDVCRSFRKKREEYIYLLYYSVEFKAPRELWNSMSKKAVTGKFHGSGGHIKLNCLQDQANFHRSQAWQIVLIFNSGIWQTGNDEHPNKRSGMILVQVKLVLDYFQKV